MFQACTRSSDASAWSLLLITVLLIASLEFRAPLAIEPASTMPFLFACAPLVFIAFFYHRVRPREKIVAIAVTLIQILTFSALGCILQYLLAREGGESWDQIFLDADRTMGLDWIGYVRWVDAHAWAATALRWGYAAMIPGAIATVISLSLLGKLDELRTFTLAGLICGGGDHLTLPAFPISELLRLSWSASCGLSACKRPARICSAGRFRRASSRHLLDDPVTRTTGHHRLSELSCWIGHSQHLGILESRHLVDTPARNVHRHLHDRLSACLWRSLFRRCDRRHCDSQLQHWSSKAPRLHAGLGAVDHGIAIPPFT